MAGLAISDGNVAASITGAEKIPVGGASNPLITPDLIAAYLGAYDDWVPVFTGFSTDPPTVTARYNRIGKRCHIRVLMGGNSVSNATTFTMTLPFNTAADANQVGTIASPVDNGVAQTAPGYMAATAGSNVLTLYKALPGTAWTGSGVKRCNFEWTFETE